MNNPKRQLMEALRTAVLTGNATDADYERCLDLESEVKADWQERNAPKWWHWLIETCPKCGPVSQGPIADCLGEDCTLFERVEEHNRDKECHCGCGMATVMKYRHAFADWNLIVNAEGEPLRKVKLMAGQTEGDSMTEAQYQARLATVQEVA